MTYYKVFLLSFPPPIFKGIHALKFFSAKKTQSNCECKTAVILDNMTQVDINHKTHCILKEKQQFWINNSSPQRWNCSDKTRQIMLFLQHRKLLCFDIAFFLLQCLLLCVQYIVLHNFLWIGANNLGRRENIRKQMYFFFPLLKLPIGVRWIGTRRKKEICRTQWPCFKISESCFLSTIGKKLTSYQSFFWSDSAWTVKQRCLTEYIVSSLIFRLVDLMKAKSVKQRFTPLIYIFR